MPGPRPSRPELRPHGPVLAPPTCPGPAYPESFKPPGPRLRPLRPGSALPEPAPLFPPGLRPPESAKPAQSLAPSTRNLRLPPGLRAPGTCVARSSQTPPTPSLAPPPGNCTSCPRLRPEDLCGPPSAGSSPEACPRDWSGRFASGSCPGPNQPAMEGDVPAAAAARYQPASPPRDACVYNSCYW